MAKKKPDSEGLEVSWETHPEKLQRALEEGDPLALDVCVLYCDHKRRRLPDWARTGLAQRGGRASDKMIVKAMKKAPNSLAMAAVDAADVCGFTFGDRFKIAEQLLKGCGAKTLQGKAPKRKNIEQLWNRHHKDIETLVDDLALHVFAERLTIAQWLVLRPAEEMSQDVEKVIDKLEELYPTNPSN